MEKNIERDLGIISSVGDGDINETNVSVLWTIKLLNDSRSSTRQQVQDNGNHDHLWLSGHGEISVKPNQLKFHES